MTRLTSLIHSPDPRSNIRLALDDEFPHDIEVKLYQLSHKRSTSKTPQDFGRSDPKKPERKMLLIRSDAKVGFSDEEVYNTIWQRGSGKADRLETAGEEFGRAQAWLRPTEDENDQGQAGGSEEQTNFCPRHARRSNNAPDIVSLMLGVLRESQQFFSREDLQWPALNKYRQEVWRDREGLLLQAFRSAFAQDDEESEHVRDMFYTFQCLLPGVLVLSHEDSCFSTKGTYRVTRCLPPLAWVRRHERHLLDIFPAKYRLCEQGLYHLGHHCATPESSLILEFRPRILESQPPSNTLLPWKEGKKERNWTRQRFFS